MHTIFRTSYPIFWAHELPSSAYFTPTTKTHRKVRDPVHSPLAKLKSAGPVVGSVTTRESPVLYVFDSFVVVLLLLLLLLLQLIILFRCFLPSSCGSSSGSNKNYSIYLHARRGIIRGLVSLSTFEKGQLVVDSSKLRATW
jgi:hypothetical protein